MPVEPLREPPIIEAVLDVQVRARPGIQASEFARARHELESEFPEVQERRTFVANLAYKGGGAAETPPSAVGQDLGIDAYVFWSADRKDAVQFRIDGFSLNRLRPYQRWELWFPKFVRLWEVYRRIAAPVAAIRVAARCINQLEVPFDARIGDYLAMPPAVPAELPQSLKGFLSRVELVDSDVPYRGVAIVQGLQIAPAGMSGQLLLDIDASETREFATDAVVGAFDALRQLRNRAFFGSIHSTLTGNLR